MEPSEKLLSIAIPTYNRSQYLRENLRIILSQAVRYREQVQIIISDNHSPEDTTSIVDSLSQEFEFPINYFCQPSNIGMNGNSQFVVSKSSGKYILLMGDDDLLAPNFLDTILPILADKDTTYSIIHWNRLEGDETCGHGKLWDRNYDGMVHQLSFFDFIKRTDDAPNFMSSVLFHRDCWELGTPHVRDSADGYRWFCIVYWGAALLKLPCLYYYMPLVIQRNPVRTYISRFPYYIIVEMSDLFHDLDAVLPGCHAFWQRHLRKKWIWTLPGVSEDRKFYRPLRDSFVPYLTRREKFWLDIWLYAPMPTLIRKIYRRFHKRPA